MKNCFKCKRTLCVSEFYVHPQMADGHLGKCKDCARRDAREHYARNIDRYHEYERYRAMLPHRVALRAAYQQTDDGRRAMTRANRHWIETHPSQRKAQHAVNNAVRDGHLVKLPCEECGTRRWVHGHHDDYSKPLDVRWLCAEHHAQWHRQRKAA